MKKNIKGAILIPALLLYSAIILGIFLSYMSWLSSQYAIVARAGNISSALMLAEAGIEEAIWTLNYTKNWQGWTVTTDGAGDTIRTKIVSSFTNADNKIIGDYTMTIKIPESTGGPVEIVAIGFVPNMSSAKAQKIVTVNLETTPLFSYAAYAKFNQAYFDYNPNYGDNGRLNFGWLVPVVTDSYDSRLGSYASQAHGEECDMVGEKGVYLDINTSGSMIHGDVHPGPGAGFTTWPKNMDPQTVITGSIAPLETLPEFPPISDDEMLYASTNNDNANMVITPTEGAPPTNLVYLELNPGGGTAIFPPGTYYFVSFRVYGPTAWSPQVPWTLIIKEPGPVVFYIEGRGYQGSNPYPGTFFIDENVKIVVQSGRPQDFTIYTTGIYFTCKAPLTATIYAPKAISNTYIPELYGSFVGMTLSVKNLHYDTSLTDYTTPYDSNYRIINYQET